MEEAVETEAIVSLTWRYLRLDGLREVTAPGEKGTIRRSSSTVALLLATAETRPPWDGQLGQQPGNADRRPPASSPPLASRPARETSTISASQYKARHNFLAEATDPKVTMLISLLMDDDTLFELAFGTLLCTVVGSKMWPGFAHCLAKTRGTLRNLTLQSAGFYSPPDCKMIVFQELDVVPSSRLCRGT
ncbi:hypothetical protein HPB51_028800 [Rhipicephalus microplus]|uniref:Uncharacterized protein n=1 Tax=Rhipicephalus microplus TaxID=6941 RepID=A0A9J6CW07_RHIMP|nr:hypothetical protein HPB51_028800 [Rhipicephalus microplus]